MRQRLCTLILTVALAAGCSSPRSGYVFLTQLRGSSPADPSTFELSADFYDRGLPDFEAGTAPGLDVTDAEGGCLLVGTATGASFEGGRVAAWLDGRELIGRDARSWAPYLEAVEHAAIDPGTPVRLTVAGSGAVPGAEVTLDTPGTPEATLPTETERDADLILTWSPDLDADVVEVRLDRILCNVAASEGSVTVSRRLLDQISLGERSLALIASRSTVQEVDGLPIVFRVGEALVQSTTIR